MRRLCESDYSKRMQAVNAAKELLQYYVYNAVEHYGTLFCVYNVHNLLHISDDVLHYRTSLHDVSAFPFENYLQKLKKLVRGKHNPLVQVCKRLDELEGLVRNRNINNFKVGFGANSWFSSQRGILHVRDKRPNGAYCCDLYDYAFLDNFFVDFLESKEVGIYLVRRHIQPSRCFMRRSNFKRKCVCLPYEDGNVIISLLHDFV